MNGAHGVGECNIASVNCARAIAQLRYCDETDRKRQSLLRIQFVDVLVLVFNLILYVVLQYSHAR